MELDVDPDEAVRAEIRAKLHEKNAEKVDKSTRPLAKVEEAGITVTLAGAPGAGAW